MAIVKYGKRSIQVSEVSREDLENPKVRDVFIRQASAAQAAKSEAEAEYKEYTERARQLGDAGDVWYDAADGLKVAISKRETPTLDADALLEALVGHFGEDSRADVEGIFKAHTKVSTTVFASARPMSRADFARLRVEE